MTAGFARVVALLPEEEAVRPWRFFVPGWAAVALGLIIEIIPADSPALTAALPWGEGESPAADERIERAGARAYPGVESRSARCQRERRPTLERRRMPVPSPGEG